jgi:hypothetical protein
MVFVISHYNSSADIDAIKTKYAVELHDNDIICCGTANFQVLPDTNLTYHPLFEVKGEVDIKQSHQYIDTMMRAIQIESPSTVVFAHATKFDSPNVLKRIKEHCDIVDAMVID